MQPTITAADLDRLKDAHLDAIADLIDIDEINTDSPAKTTEEEYTQAVQKARAAYDAINDAALAAYVAELVRINDSFEE